MKKLFVLVFALMLVFINGSVRAKEKAEGNKTDSGSELEKLKSRVETLEKRMEETEVVDELGHKLHPIHSIYGLKISGDITLTGQGVSRVKGANTRGAAAISADIAIESPVGKNGRAVVVLDFENGGGLRNLPAFFTSPNGNPTGPNNDIESFNNDQVHVAQAYYEHAIAQNLIVSVGQLDITGYFDANGFANSERVQFLANTFVNNPTIEFGGSVNFYGPGVRVTYWPVENIDISLGAFEGDGNYVDTFDNPFLMAEFNLRVEPMGKKGNYRLYYWNRQGRPELTNTANPNDAALLKAQNNGVGVSIDQKITDGFGMWLRAGEQRKKVAQFDRHISLGANVTGEPFGRPNDSIGVGAGFTFMGKDYRDFKKSRDANFKDSKETYLEAYYNIALGEAADYSGFHITPDIQYVVNPGGDSNASKLFIYGVRLQAFF